MILNHCNDSFPTVSNMILFWRKSNNFNMTSFSTSVELYFKISVRLSGLFLHIESEIPLGWHLRSLFFKNKYSFSLFYTPKVAERCIFWHFLAFLPSSQGDRDGQIWVILGLWLLCRDISRCMLNCVTICIFRCMGGHRILLGHQRMIFSSTFAQLSGGPGWSDLSNSGFMASF